MDEVYNPDNPPILPEDGLGGSAPVDGLVGDPVSPVIENPGVLLPVPGDVGDLPIVGDPVSVEPEPVIENPEESISNNQPVEETPKEEQKEEQRADNSNEALPYNIVVESPEYQLSSNVTVSVNTESVSLDALIDAISQNQVSMNVSNNTLSYSTIQILSVDNVPWFDKPFEDYTTSEGILFTMMITLMLGYLFHRLGRGLNVYDL